MDAAGIWTENFRVQAYMVDHYRQLTLPALGNLFQEAANNHANFHQLGFFEMKARGLFWVLNRMRLMVHTYPHWLDTIAVRTWVTAMHPFAHRHLEVCNAAGDPLAHGYSIWLPLDAVSHKPRRLEQVNVPMPNYPNPCPMPDKLSDLAEDTPISSMRTVAYSDLDMLGHVNNVQYVQWIVDDYYRQLDAPSIRAYTVQYVAESFHGDVIALHKMAQGDQINYWLRRTHDGSTVCRACLEL